MIFKEKMFSNIDRPPTADHSLLIAPPAFRGV